MSGVPAVPLRAAPRRADLVALLSLALIATAFFGDVLAGVNDFYLRDLTRYYYPTKHILREVVLHGEFPYWNRYYSAGQPIAANPEHEVFYPLTWLILLPSYDFGFRLHILIHIYIGLFAMYALLRSMELRPFPSWFGAMAWGLGGLYLSYINLLPILFSAAWLPLTCLFVRRFLLRNNVRDFCAASLFFGLQFLVGEPTTVMQTGLLIGLYALYRGWYAVPRIASSIRNAGRIAAVSVVAFAIGAAQMLPGFDHLHDSARARGLTFDLVRIWSMPALKIAELVYPNLLGHISVGGAMVYWGGLLYPEPKSPFLFSIYPGLLVIALCGAAAFVRPRGGRFVLLVCGVSMLLALGAHTPLLFLLYKTGLFASMRYPEKFAMMGIFAIILFASQMLERLLNADDVLRARTVAFLAVATAIAVVALAPWYGRTFATLWGIARPEAAAKAVAIAHDDWILAAVRGLLAIGAVSLATGRKQRAGVAAIAIFVIADLGYTLKDVNPRMPRRFFDPPPIASVLPPNRASFRLFHEVDWYDQDYIRSGPAEYWIVRNGLFLMTPAESGIRTVLDRDVDLTALLPTVDFTRALWEVKRAGRADWYEPFMAMSNAWYRTGFRDLDAELRRAGGDFTKIKPVFFIAAQPYPRYYFADRMIAIGGPRDFVDQLARNRYGPRVAFVEGAPFTPSDGVVHHVVETANGATIDVESAGRGFLVMSVTRHKYWDVRVDGARVAIVPANIAYQGITVPPGRHRVTMRYQNPLVPIGMAISGAVAALLIGLAVYNPRP